VTVGRLSTEVKEESTLQKRQRRTKGENNSSSVNPGFLLTEGFVEGPNTQRRGVHPARKGPRCFLGGNRAAGGQKDDGPGTCQEYLGRKKKKERKRRGESKKIQKKKKEEETKMGGF